MKVGRERQAATELRWDEPIDSTHRLHVRLEETRWENMPDEGYLAGGYYQEYYNLDSKGTPGIVHQWGLITADQQLLGQGLLPTGFAGSAADRVRYAWLFRTDQAAALGALKVVGGRQNWGEVGGGVDVEDAFLWGSRTPFEVEAYSSISYLDLERAWLYSNISFYVTAGSDSQSQGSALSEHGSNRVTWRANSHMSRLVRGVMSPLKSSSLALDNLGAKPTVGASHRYQCSWHPPSLDHSSDRVLA
jgi:hypothetical protein